MWLQPVQSASDLKREPWLTYLTAKQRKNEKENQIYFVLENQTGILHDKMQKNCITQNNTELWVYRIQNIR